jgi:hypothetical protein
MPQLTVTDCAEMICEEDEFLHFLEKRAYYVWGTVDEKQAKHLLCELCGVKSLDDLATDLVAAQKFDDIAAEYRRGLASRPN